MKKEKQTQRYQNIKETFLHILNVGIRAAGETVIVTIIGFLAILFLAIHFKIVSLSITTGIYSLLLGFLWT